MSSSIVLLGLCVLVWIVTAGLLLNMYRLRRAEPACARCMQAVIGISSSQCPECGSSFEGGVVQPWGKPLRARTYSGVAVIVAGVLGAVVALPHTSRVWAGALESMGLIYPAYQVDHQVDLRWPGGDVMRVELDLIQPNDSLPVAGTVRLTLLQNDQIWASWQGEGVANMKPRRDPKGINFDAEEAIAYLATQVDRSDPSVINRSLQNASGREALAAIAQSLALPSQTFVMNTWIIEEQPNGKAERTQRGTRTIYPAFWWYLPGYTVPVALFIIGLVLGIRLLSKQRSLMPFSDVARVPQVS